MIDRLGLIVISLLASSLLQAAPSQTQLEESGWTELTTYERMMDYLEPLVKSSPLVKMESIGASVSGRSIPALYFSKDDSFASRRDEKPVVMIICQHHGNEPTGKEAALAVGVGLVVYVLWVRMDWPWAMQGTPTGYNPFQEGATVGFILAGIRVFGAAVVVPLKEELFWRSFLIRWIINPDAFEKVPLGLFSLGSFAATVILFGLEHNLWLAGMMAGAIYNGLLYRTRRLWPCIIAHATTNLALGIHVLITQEWQWW